MVLNGKQRLSVSVSAKTIELIDESLKLEQFRNKSHVVEFSINKVLKTENKSINQERNKNE